MIALKWGLRILARICVSQGCVLQLLTNRNGWIHPQTRETLKRDVCSLPTFTYI